MNATQVKAQKRLLEALMERPGGYPLPQLKAEAERLAAEPFDDVSFAAALKRCHSKEWIYSYLNSFTDEETYAITPAGQYAAVGL